MPDAQGHDLDLERYLVERREQFEASAASLRGRDEVLVKEVLSFCEKTVSLVVSIAQEDMRLVVSPVVVDVEKMETFLTARIEQSNLNYMVIDPISLQVTISGEEITFMSERFPRQEIDRIYCRIVELVKQKFASPRRRADFGLYNDPARMLERRQRERASA